MLCRYVLSSFLGAARPFGRCNWQIRHHHLLQILYPCTLRDPPLISPQIPHVSLYLGMPTPPYSLISGLGTQSMTGLATTKTLLEHRSGIRVAATEVLFSRWDSHSFSGLSTVALALKPSGLWTLLLARQHRGLSFLLSLSESLWLCGLTCHLHLNLHGQIDHFG